MLYRALVSALLCMLLASAARGQDTLRIQKAFPALTFDLPVDLAADGAGTLYVVEQGGLVYAFPNDSTTTEKHEFLDLSDVVHVDNEAGLLSLSFHPDYSENGYLYVYYVTESPEGSETTWRSILSRFTRSESDPLAVDPASEVVILEIPQPTDRHNAGETAFGSDGYLYLSLGDGSAGGDAYNHAQNLETLKGSILRIDVDNPEEGKQYGIPADNPFAGNLSGYREEIYAYGFRNPWRFSIDQETGHLWVGDVGEQTWEEVDFVVKGGNYGWPIFEGGACYNPPENCSQDDLYSPVWYYDHEVGRSVTGGYVYRGSRVPELVGKYVFADWGGRQLFALDYREENPHESDREPDVTELVNTGRLISSFGVDEHQELYMLSLFHDGYIYRFESSSGLSNEPPEVPEPAFELALDGPNPFATQTSFRLTLDAPSHIHIGLYDLLGRKLGTLYEGFMAADVEREITLSAGSLPDGLYFVRVRSSSGDQTQKVIVRR